MRIVIDLQGAQSDGLHPGIGRYSLALALGIARNAGRHELWIVLNARMKAPIAGIRRAFDGLVPAERICVFDTVPPDAENSGRNPGIARANEAMREYFIRQLRPDAVLVTSLSESCADAAVTSIGSFTDGADTAVILYDPDSGTAAQSPWQRFEGKIDSLRKAGLVLTISDYSRKRAIEGLKLDPTRVVTIPAAAAPRFVPARQTQEELAALHRRFGINRRFLMHNSGGFDRTTDIDCLIAAYSLLPQKLRADCQLLIAGEPGKAGRHNLGEQCRRFALRPDELILTGKVSEETMVELYGAAALSVFPSRNEVFGEPVLEAMACGTLVTGADSGVIPELLDCDEALFDATSPQSIAAKIDQVLTDGEMQNRLRERERARSAGFSWDSSARLTLSALEARFQARSASRLPPPEAVGDGKRRLAFVSPLPPERTGIADYAAQLLPYLLQFFEIELIVRQSAVTLPEELATLPRRTVDWFVRNAGQYDQILYQFGNSAFHSHMFALLREHPGVVVLHDFFLSSVLAHEQISGAIPGIWTDSLLHSHGYQAVQASLIPDGNEAAVNDFPCNLAVIEGATRVIAHSDYSFSLAQAWYGTDGTRFWTRIPLSRSAPETEDRLAARLSLGIKPEVFLVCSFGFIGPTKLTHHLLQAWIESSLREDHDCELVFVGANSDDAYGARITESIRNARAKNRIRIVGWSDDQTYRLYLQAADVGVQLRGISRGETSGAVLDCMNYGLPTIVNANGSMAELPDNAVMKLQDIFTVDELIVALEKLRKDDYLRAGLGIQARLLLQDQHRPEQCARKYKEALDLAYAEAATDRHALIRTLAGIPHLITDDRTLRQFARCMARAPDHLRQRQLLVDVTAIAQEDFKTGIQRVVRTQLLELLRLRSPGLRIEPVYLSTQNGYWHYRYASNYAWKLMGIDPGPHAADPLIDIQAGDKFYCPDYALDAVLGAAEDGIYADWRTRGVEVNFLIHDLLPVLRPDFFPTGTDTLHSAWLTCIAEQADRLICISEAVERELSGWLGEHRRGAAHCLKLAVLHHGADIGIDAPLPALHDYPLLARIGATPSFLMVGTIEPRKGHLQALAAFEKIWQDGGRINLVIVGNEGWKSLPAPERSTIPRIVERLTHHPELGRRLFWLQGIDDDYLQQVYLASACLLAASEGEGFGLPLIEAARCKLPIIARDLPVFREVAQDNAFYFSGLGAADLAHAISAWLALRAEGRHPESTALRWSTWRENVGELMAILAGQRPERVWTDTKGSAGGG